MNIELHNPNASIGLLRAKFSIAVIGQDQSIITVYGQGGLPGTTVSTIYQLPPLGTYGYTDDLPKRSPAIDHIEVTIPEDQWLEWSDVQPPQVEVISPVLGRAYGNYPRITGRVQIANTDEGPFNVQLFAFVEHDENFVIVSGFVECAATGQAQAFQIDGFSRIRGGQLASVLAYVTTVPGVPGTSDDADEPPRC